jgi:hypothetical protein
MPSAICWFLAWRTLRIMEGYLLGITSQKMKSSQSPLGQPQIQRLRRVACFLSDTELAAHVIQRHMMLEAYWMCEV